MRRSALFLAALLIPILTCYDILAQSQSAQLRAPTLPSRATNTRSLYQLEGKVRALEHVQFQLLGFIAITHGIDASKAIVSDAKAVLYKELDYCDEKWDRVPPSESPGWDEIRRRALKILNKMKERHCAGAKSAMDRLEQAIQGIEDAVTR